MFIFVYGTLQTGFKNHVSVVRGRATSLGPATFAGARLVHYPAGFPGMYRVDEPGSWHVHGELLRVPPEHSTSVLTDMDQLEDYFGPGHPSNMYSREEVVVSAGRVQQHAFTYFSLLDPVKERAVPVPSGNWRAFMDAHHLVDAGEDWASKPACMAALELLDPDLLHCVLSFLPLERVCAHSVGAII